MFGGLLGAVAVGLLVLLPGRDHGGVAEVALVALAITVLFFAAESSQIHIEVQRQSWSVSLSELPFVLGLFLLPPLWLLLGRVVAAAFVFGLRRTTLPKAIFNLGLFAAEVAGAALLFQALHAGLGLRARDWLIAYVTMLLVTVFAAVAVTVGITVQQGRMAASELARTLPVVGLAAVLNTTLALLSLLVIHVNRAALLLLAGLVAVVAAGYRAYQRLQRQHADLGQLFAFTQSVGTAESDAAVLAQLLAEAPDLMQAEQSILLGPPGAAGSVPQVPELPRGPVVIPRGTRDPVLRSWLDATGLRDAMLVPLHDGEQTVGVLQLGNRIGAMSTFTHEDLRLLQTLIAHAEALRSKNRLVQLRRHEAHHDGLTGLANRELLLLRINEILAGGLGPAPGSTAHAVIVLIDLDRFREVNDTLGHQVGNVLLSQVGARLQAATPADAMVARLGGDEFAVLLLGDIDAATAMELAGELVASVAQPFEVEGAVLDISASAGVALIPDDGDVAAAVLQHADIAMYAAKRTVVRVARYNSDEDRRSVARLALAGELRRAIDTDQLVVYYQPQLELKSATFVGFEALVRWQHPTRGLLAPDDFVPIAEQVGLIGPLTSAVLRQALRTCRTWLPTHPGVGVAVNLSARGLLEPTLTATVARLLADTGVDPRLLTLEITETTVMSDFDAALAALHELHALGLRLSIDDFGTGYSSLSYLARLPVHEVKIDRSFVSAMEDSADAVAIVRTVIELCHTLRLNVVAEGVEGVGSLAALTEMNCDTAQGYLLGRPLSQQSLARWPRHVPSARTASRDSKLPTRR
ncbi:MAG: EAL domain-containing protein [Actinomycetota bacterium]|nr:EAL domain-containing protein [Actinomycetota bacterium]